MVKKSVDREIYQLHAELCKSLSNPTRLEILNLLRDGEMPVNQLATTIGVRQANLSQHLAVLRQRGVVTVRRDGVSVYYKLANPKMIQACDIIREVLLELMAKSELLVRRAKGDKRR